MTAAISRKDLYDLVWTTPLKILAAQFSISDVGLRKICVKASIPTPERGYWATKSAGSFFYHVPKCLAVASAQCLGAALSDLVILREQCRALGRGFRGSNRHGQFGAEIDAGDE